MNFEDAVELVLKHEGGYSNDSRDAGGETNYGISKSAYPNIDIKKLTKDDAIKIYRADYWDKINADLLPKHLRYIAFDCAVNQGVSFCKRELESIIYLSPLSEAGQIDEFKRRRKLRYEQNKRFDVYGNGWISRLEDVAKKTISQT